MEIHQRLRELELQRVAGLFFLHFIVKSLSVKALCERNPFRLGGIHSLSMLLTHSFNAINIYTHCITHTTQRSQFYFLLGIYFLDKELFTLFPKCVTDTNPYEQSFVSTTSHNLIQNLLIQAYIWKILRLVKAYLLLFIFTCVVNKAWIASSTLLLFLTAKEISMVKIAGSEQIWLKESTHVERGDQLHATFASTHFLLAGEAMLNLLSGIEKPELSQLEIQASHRAKLKWQDRNLLTIPFLAFWHFLAFLGSYVSVVFPGIPEITNIFILWLPRFSWFGGLIDWIPNPHNLSNEGLFIGTRYSSLSILIIGSLYSENWVNSKLILIQRARLFPGLLLDNSIFLSVNKNIIVLLPSTVTHTL
ncbi:hypothetical protein ACJX0J_012418 [Zea mays]